MSPYTAPGKDSARDVAIYGLTAANSASERRILDGAETFKSLLEEGHYANRPEQMNDDMLPFALGFANIVRKRDTAALRRMVKILDGNEDNQRGGYANDCRETWKPDRRALPGRSFSYTPRNIFVGKSARIVRRLLTDRDRLWTQAGIVSHTGSSSGLVSRIVQHLISQGYAEKTSAREFRLLDTLPLLDAWADAGRFPKRNRITLYAGFLGSPVELANRLQEWARDEAVSIAFTQWLAAWIRHPFTEPVVASAYVSRLPDATALGKLGLRPVSEGGKLWLHVPNDESPLTEIQVRSGLTLATDAQIYLDLQRTGLRGPDAAAALREWKGFCRP